jgi:Mce-associated membrane protein
MSRVNPRRPASSRTPVSRRRRVAGQATPATTPSETDGVVGQDVVEPDAAEPPDLEAEPVSAEAVEAPVVETPVDEGPDPDAPGTDQPQTQRRGMAALFDSRRVTVALALLIMVLGLVAGGLAIRQAVADSDGSDVKPPPKGEIAVPDDNPVLIGGADATAAAADAAKAATTLFTRTASGYDEQVDAATELMTEDYAAEFRQTTDDVKEAFVADKTEVEVRIVAQGVVRANRSQVQVLLFLNQYVSKDGGETTYTPYRALVTMVHTEGGWLVSDLDTK